MPFCPDFPYTTSKKYGINDVFGKYSGNTWIWLLICGNGLAPTTNKYCDFNATLMCSIMNENCNLQSSKSKIPNWMHKIVSFFYTLLKIPHNFYGNNHYVVNLWQFCVHYSDVIMSQTASQIPSFTIVYSIVYSGTDQRKHQSSASLAFMWGNHRGPVNSPHKWPVTRKIFPFDDVIMYSIIRYWPHAISSKSKCQIRILSLGFPDISYFLPVVYILNSILISLIFISKKGTAPWHCSQSHKGSMKKS